MRRRPLPSVLPRFGLLPLLLALLLSCLIAPRASAATTARLSGDDRYSTAVAVSKSAFPAGGVPVVYVATGDNFPDALAGGAAASYGKGPMLLVAADSVPAAVATELGRLKPGRIVIQGGSDVVSDAVATALKTYTTGAVTRNAGADRYDTAVATSSSTFPAAFGGSVFLATGENYPDALSSGSLFGPFPGPVLLTPATGGLTASVKAELTRLHPARVFLLGGSDVVPAQVATDVAGLGLASERLAGDDRYATALAIAQRAYPNAGSASEVFVATGENFPDGLAAGPLAGVRRGPVLLTNGTCWDAATLAYLKRLAPTRITLIGGADVLADAVGALSACAAAPVTLEGVSSADAQQLVLATYSGANAGTVSYYEFDGTSWNKLGSVGATFGYNGVMDSTLRHEGDGTTPLGTFPLLSAFGEGDPGTAMPYQTVTDCSWWISDGAESDYNRWREACGDQGSKNVHLMDYVTSTIGQYRQALVIGFNYDNPVLPPAAGSGSGVMLHYQIPGRSTAGCVGVTSRSLMDGIVVWADPAKHPTIVIRNA